MPTQKQATVDLLDGNRTYQGPGTAGTKGRDDASLSKSFPDSPIIGKTVTITDEERHETYQDLALDGTVLNGWCFDSFNRDYSKNGAPSLENPAPGSGTPDVVTGGGGLPGSPHLPNPASPGVASNGDLGVAIQSNGVNPANIPEPPTNLEDLPQHASRPPYVGEGSALSPKVSSKRTPYFF